jgi:hypothetical protein
VVWLLEQGADPTLRERRWDDLAGDWARYRGFTEVEVLLRESVVNWSSPDEGD